MPLYQIVFTDNSIFLGGDTIEDSKWNEIPDKEIFCLEYFLCDGSSLVLRNFESYAAITEAIDNVIEELGDCPKCGYVVKVVNGTLKYGDGSSKKQSLARCKNKEKTKDDKIKCGWVGRIMDVKNLRKAKGKRNKFIMGLRNGIVTSHRITLKGTSGEDRYQEGDVTTRKYPKGKEYHGKKPIADYAWKKGIIKKEVK